jgi:hypothetical protein
MGRRLIAADDWRVFAEWAKQQPKHGGMYYASVAVSACGDIKQQLKISQVPQEELARDPGAVAQARSASRDVLMARCGSFLDSEVGLRAPLELREQGRKSGDPLATAWSDLSATLSRVSSTREERLAAFEQVLATHDAQFMLGAGLMFAVHSPVVGGVTEDRGLVASAWNLAACSFGVDCSAKGMDVLIACTYFGNCYASSRELLEQDVLKERGEDGWRKVQELAARIASDVNAGDASSFLAQR